MYGSIPIIYDHCSHITYFPGANQVSRKSDRLAEGVSVDVGVDFGGVG